jgi:hypothetical protein
MADDMKSVIARVSKLEALVSTMEKDLTKSLNLHTQLIATLAHDSTDFKGQIVRVNARVDALDRKK